jgi:hypothetical protein
MKVFSFVSALLACSGAAFAGGVTGSGLVVLDTSANGALSMTGNSTVYIPAKAVYVNSNSSSAVKTVGNASLDAPDVYCCGGFSFSGNSGCTGAVHPACTPYANPLSGLAFPSANGMSSNAAVNIGAGQNVTLSPGSYPNGIKIQGNSSVTFSPGVYLVGNQFKVTAGSISGSGVCIVMVGGAMAIAGTSSLNLSPPADGPMAGVVICQYSSDSEAMSLAGGSEVNIGGTIYAPSSTLTLVGNSSLVGEGPQMGDLVVAKRVSIAGTGSVKIGHADSAAIVLPKLPLAD